MTTGGNCRSRNGNRNWKGNGNRNGCIGRVEQARGRGGLGAGAAVTRQHRPDGKFRVEKVLQEIEAEIENCDSHKTVSYHTAEKNAGRATNRLAPSQADR